MAPTKKANRTKAKVSRSRSSAAKNKETTRGGRPKALKFALTTRNLPAGSSDDDVAKVQRYLRRFGYLTEGYEERVLDRATQNALSLFQARMNLPRTGVLDPSTASALELPRCGVPDLPGNRAASGVSPAFSLRGCDYETRFRTLTYCFVLGSPDVAGLAEKQAVRDAFATWQREISIDFEEVGLANNPNFTIGWFTGDHGDGSAFDGIGNVLAHAFYPPPCGGPHAGKCHFDEAESWALAHSTGNFDIETVALHEVGHLLGLEHSSVPGSVMFPTYGGLRRSLAADDIAGIRALYGRRGPSLDVLVHLEGIGDAAFRENEFAGTRGQSRRLEGIQIRISPPVANLSMRYMSHLQGIGDAAFVGEGQLTGTRGQSRRLEGFAIELTGSSASRFNVFYMAHLQGIGDTGIFQNGQFCGTRGQSRRAEGILVRVEPR